MEVVTFIIGISGMKHPCQMTAAKLRFNKCPRHSSTFIQRHIITNAMRSIIFAAFFAFIHIKVVYIKI